jgi:protoporphyrinogen oxidase
MFFSALKYQLTKRLYVLKDGNGAICKKIAKNLKVNLNNEVIKINVENDKVVGICVKEKEGIREISFDAVVCGIEANRINNLISELNDDVKNFLNNVKYSKSIAIIFGTKIKITNGTYAIALPRIEGFSLCAISDITLKNQNHVNNSSGVLIGFPIDKYGRYIISEDEDKVKDKLSKEVEKIFYNLKDNLTFTKIYKWDFALPIFKPGYLNSLVNFKQKEINIKGLFFAGDYLVTPSVEGALTSGIRAKDNVEKYLRR